jgi:hypothetical protein
MALSQYLTNALIDLVLADERRFPPAADDARGWFGVALYDALEPIHGESPLVEAWPSSGAGLFGGDRNRS